MPLDIIGDYAASGSSGASARNAARVSNSSPSTAAPEAAAPAVRDEKPRQEVAVSAPDANVAVYVSPFIRFDITSRLAIVEIRNSDTGEVQQQYPSPRAVREYAQNLPEDSNLRAKPADDGSQPRIIGSAADIARSSTQPSGVENTPAPAAPVSPQASSAAAAAFSGLQSVPTGGKQGTVA